MAYIFVALILALAARDATSYSAGAPKDVCQTMIPQHPYKPQSSAAPYAVEVSTSQVKSGESVEVRLLGRSPTDTIKGFLVQARQGDQPIGTFDVSGSSQYAQTLDCGSAQANTATHKKHGSDPQSVSLKWSPPADQSGIVKFRATVMLDGATFWVGLLSKEVKFN